MAIEIKQANDEEKGLICPFTPYVATNHRSYTCVREACQLWDSKKGDCGLKNV
jgi:hypothetical protein